MCQISEAKVKIAGIENLEVIRSNYIGSDKLINKVALITGGDSGIGRSVAVHFAREDADIFIVYHESDLDANQAKEMVESSDASSYISGQMIHVNGGEVVGG